MLTKFSDDLKIILAKIDKNTTFEFFLREYAGKETRSTIAFLVAFFAFFVAIPTPSVGLATPLSLMIIFLTLSLTFNGTLEGIIQRLPLKIKTRPIGKFGVGFTHWSLRLVKIIEFFVRSRLPVIFSFIMFRSLRYLVYFIILICAFFMLVPIPLTNTAPAMLIFLLGLSIMQRDGLLLLLSLTLGPLFLFAFYYLLISGAVKIFT